MKKLALFILIIPFLNSCISVNNGGNSGGGNAGNTSTRNPNVRRTAADYTEIRKVELTDRYTIVHIRHTNTKAPSTTTQRLPGGRTSTNTESSNIRIKRETRLLGLNGQRSFRLLKAEGIPVDPQYKVTQYGDRTDFVLYFERLDPGIELFDLFECNDYDNMVCWNFYDVQVTNPGPKDQAPSEGGTRTNVPGETEISTQKPQVYVKEIAVRGVVRDAKTLKPITAKIDYKLAVKNTAIDSIMSFPGSGEYKIRLQNNQVYTYTVTAPGYLVLTDNVDLTKAVEGQNITRDILLTAIVIGEKITLKNIFFDVAKFELLPASFAELDRLVKLMSDNPKMEIKLEGHTDVVGDAAANLQLSKDRVNEVKKYLVNKGIKAERITTEGYGSTKPIVAKGTDEERKVNRRVEFVITKQ